MERSFLARRRSPFFASSAISVSWSVVFPIADATTTTLFLGEYRWIILAAFFILAALARDVPPNFITSFNVVPLCRVFLAYADEVSNYCTSRSLTSGARPDEGYVTCVLCRECERVQCVRNTCGVNCGNLFGSY